MTKLTYTRVAEAVGVNHPDKLADQISDGGQDIVIDRAIAFGVDPSSVRTAIETMVVGKTIILSGEVTAPGAAYRSDLVEARAREIYLDAENDPSDELRVINLIRPQAGEIAAQTVDGAGDQGAMIGYATTETDTMMPRETSLAWGLVTRAHDLARSGALPGLRYDTKSQVVLNPDGTVGSVVMSVQHRADYALDDLRRDIAAKVIFEVLGEIDPRLVKVNAKGTFIEGGADADCGLTGRKIVVDAYGPRVPVGGGAYSGKDPSKVDRSAAYQARQIARTVLERHPGGGNECLVTIGFGIGQVAPESLSAIVDGRHDVSDWVRAHFDDLSPRAIQERLGLWRRQGWRFEDTARFGHYGRNEFPWEHPAF